MTPREFYRFYIIIYTLLRYRLDQLIPNIPLTRPMRWARWLFFFWLPAKYPNKPLGERLRLALQSLGPVWIKFGQMLSTRRDLFSAEVADELARLQDQVAPFAGELAKQQIEQALQGPLSQWFAEFDMTPLASASIAQVHTARLKANQQQVVIKVIRPAILATITADMNLLRRLAAWLAKLLPESRRLRPQEVVRDYQRSLFNELNLQREAANGIQLKRNFKDSPLLYVPDIYADLCRENVLVMERIYGIPIADISRLRAANINLQVLAERGVEVFFTQVFRDSFFHADMHPGNIFVNPAHPEQPQYIAIDFGIVGVLNKEDKRYLAENFLAFFNRDYRKVAELHVASGWVPPDTNIEEFEFSIRTVCEPIFEKPLADISFAHVLINLFNTARDFNMQVQPQLVLLQKTLLYVEGLGRQLYPQLDLWKTAKPFLEVWLKKQVGVPAFFRSLKEKLPYWGEKLPELPELLHQGLRQQNQLAERLDALTLQLKQQHRQNWRARYALLIGLVCFLLAALALFFITKLTISVLLFIGGLVSWLIGWLQIK